MRSQVCFDRNEYVVYEAYRGLHLAYHAKKFLYSGKSRYQTIEIIDNDAYGVMLFLDQNVQHTAYDAETFNNALCEPLLKGDYTKVLVFGGGSGQTIKCLLGSRSIENITMVEIDKKVINSSKRFIPGMKEALSSPRLETIIGDAFQFIHNTRRTFDACVLDLTESPLICNLDDKSLKNLYITIKRKCAGRCVQYIGSSVGLSPGPRFKHRVQISAPQILSDVKFRKVFIPSFGAPHWIMHAGFD